MLIAEAVVTVTLSPDGCDVIAGAWIDRYTGQRVTDPAKLDVDHIVPLANANASGGASWTRQRKRAYANDLQRVDALVAVTASVNRSKGSRSPDSWRPPNRSSWCWYATAWVTVKVTWDLAVTPAERSALSDMLSTC